MVGNVPFTKNVSVIPADFLTIRPDDSPGIRPLKRLASLDTTQQGNLPEDLMPKRKI